MADAKLTALSSSTAPAANDWLYLVLSGGGDRKATRGQILLGLDNSGADATAITIDSGERIIAGHTTTVLTPNTVTDGSGVNAQIQLHGTTVAGTTVSVTRYAAAGGGPGLSLNHSRGSLGTPGTALVADDDVGSIAFGGDDGTDLLNIAANIVVEVDDAVATGQVPGRLMISTGSTAGTLTEAVRVDSAQDVTLAGNLVLSNDTLGAAAANTVRLTSVDLSAGNTILALDTEGTPTASGTAVSDGTLAINVNGTVLHLLYSTTAAA